METRKFRALIRQLRKYFPVTQRVKVVRRRITKGDIGLTTFNGSEYRIRIKSNQDADGQLDTLLHEWGHVCAIEEAYEHRGRWATLFGEIYDAWTRNFAPQAPKNEQ